jgi:hypothetical protein
MAAAVTISWVETIRLSSAVSLLYYLLLFLQLEGERGSETGIWALISAVERPRTKDRSVVTLKMRV